MRVSMHSKRSYKRSFLVFSLFLIFFITGLAAPAFAKFTLRPNGANLGTFQAFSPIPQQTFTASGGTGNIAWNGGLPCGVPAGIPSGLSYTCDPAAPFANSYL